MSPEEVLKEVIGKLEKHKIDYMVTGSFASNLHGVPRTTLDADIVISASFEKIESFMKEIEKDFYTDLNIVKEAVEQRKMFNVVHYETGFKVDFIMKKAGSYYEKEFERRRIYQLAGKPCFFTSPEDTILSKLVWAKKTESERQFQDALGVAKIQWDNLDYEYLKKWSDVLNVSDLLKKIVEEI